MPERLVILGATGSVGRSAADVVLSQPGRFQVEAVVGGRDAEGLARVARSLDARFAALSDASMGPALKEHLAGSGIASGAGEAAVFEAVDREAETVLAAIGGTAGLRPTHRAIRPGRRIALANKESLVCAGAAFMRDARAAGVEIAPVDSEHNALQQALAAGSLDDVVTATLTASGGPFRTWPIERIAAATPEEAARHPTYAMGAKINVDSATLMNKGLELIEAHHLFGLGVDRLDVVVHPQSIIHALVRWRDAAVTAGLALPDMRVPIANSLARGVRLRMPLPGLDLAAIGTLTFEAPDEARFPSLGLAREALRRGGALPAVLNAANEVAVAAFMARRIGCLDIPALVERTCNASVGWNLGEPSTVEEALWIDGRAREAASGFLEAVTA